MRKQLQVLSMVLLVAALVALPGVARSAMWVGGEIGGTFFAGTDLKETGPFFNAQISGAKISPAVIGGVTIGYDFVNSGFGGYAWPDWMKYFFFATDFTYNRMTLPNQFVEASINGVNLGTVNLEKIEGYMAAWTFLFAFHYGFMPDSEVPAGRIHPYIGAGPAILFSGLNLKGLGSHSNVSPALVVEAGIRWICLKNVSVDTAFRYRYASPTHTFTDDIGDKIDLNANVNNFSFLLRANYHF
jgi:hypothetical protein